MIIRSQTAKQVVIKAINNIITDNEQYIDTLTLFSNQEAAEQIRQDDLDTIEQVKIENKKLQKLLQTVEKATNFDLAKLRSTLFRLCFVPNSPRQNNISFEAKLSSIGKIDCLIEIGFAVINESAAR